jgi:hypothetical protein
MDFNSALGIVRLLINSGLDRDSAITNPAIPLELKERIRETLEREDTIILQPIRVLSAGWSNDDWLTNYDRSLWHYWLNLRTYLISYKNFSNESIRSLDEATDRILGQLVDPSTDQFNIRGLVLGYVQSGKTANYTGLIAKAVDVGYRLIIVMSGTDNGLRRQTQIRLDRELVGYADKNIPAVQLPPMGKQWHQFTNEDINGDFQVVNTNAAALQGTQPVLLVIKKNGTVLRRLHAWLDSTSADIRKTLPVLIIDDEADLASIDTRGTYQTDDEIPDDYAEPTVINGLVRGLLEKFNKRAYVAYTATPFANILIPHDTFDPDAHQDLYPRDFIIDLPKPVNYFGAEEQFGRIDPETGEEVGGLDTIRLISDDELDVINRQRNIPPSLENAILDFVLASAARAQRGELNSPSTMLLHGSYLILKQMEWYQIILDRFSELKNEWRYLRKISLASLLEERWENEFIPISESSYPDRVVPFSKIYPFINQIFESIQVKVINSRTGDILDYETEPNLKAIAVGGNKLSRGLTLEGLTTSYFFRSSPMYDTLMQMGRWFGFRKGYEDLVRVYMTADLASWFSDLARVEYELRQDIQLYEAMNVTPLELGTRILKHPAMLVTSRMKKRFARTIIVKQSYSGKVMQTFRFPFSRPSDLSYLLDNNLNTTKDFLNNIGNPEWIDNRPVWANISPNDIIHYLENYCIDPNARNIYLPLIIQYIQNQNELNELINWTVIVRGRENNDSVLGKIDFGLQYPIPMISRTKLKSDRDSLGVITSPNDETLDLNKLELEQLEGYRNTAGIRIGINPAARGVRPSSRGLLLIYPVSRFSGYETPCTSNREPIFMNPDDTSSQDVICLALSFPETISDEGIEGEYLIGTVDGRTNDFD